MADVKWIKITTNIFDDEKILLIESLPDSYAIITVWFKLLCLAGKQNNSGVFMLGQLPYTDNMLATIFRMKESTVTMALKTFQQFGMVEIIDGVITIPNWNKHQTLDAYEKKKERDRLYQAERRANQRALIEKSSDTSLEKSSDIVISEEDKEVDKEEDKEVDKEIKKKSKKKKEDTLNLSLFESIYSSYNLSDTLIEKIKEWLKYKTERKDEYTEQGLKSLLSQIKKKSNEYDDPVLCELIEESMSNNWKGIIFERLKDKPKKNVSHQKSYDTDEFFDTAVKASLTAMESEEVRRKAEDLKKRLG